MDQCKYCSVKGDFEECLKTECGHHNNWFTVELLKQIEELKQKQPESTEFWVTRDKGVRSLALFYKYPEKDYQSYYGKGFCGYLPDHLFPSVTWESGPKRVKMILED